ncbi:hypothetical protein [Acinetobacter schindleri]|uniref:Lipoprotein n=2 Tax=Acinetobacter schindleri TaxID=108981 RepID=N9APF8_9GAMM|nr:hypothetical protein [Acinetobacter schindleri]ENV45570.1 hypothetical protein F955_00565 [Acinetobacter schindleri CIP 107287]
MNNRVFKLTTLAIATSLLAACGGGGGGSSKPGFNSKEISGVAVDFYLAGADVDFTNSNCEAAYPDLKTDENGKFTFNTTPNCQETGFIITGGIDTVTKLPFTGQLKVKEINYQAASTTEIVATPLTTLQAELPAAEFQDVLSKLGFSLNEDVTTFDPITEGTNNQQAAVFVLQQILTQLEDSGLTMAQAVKAIQTTVATTPLLTNLGVNTTAVTLIFDTAAQSASDEVKTALQENQAKVEAVTDIINTAVNTTENAKLEDYLTDNPTVIADIQDNLASASYSGLSVAGKNIQEIIDSRNDARLSVDKNAIDSLAQVKFILNKATTDTDSIKLGFQATAAIGQNGQPETLTAYISKVNVSFDNNIAISKITVPAGAVIEIETTLANSPKGSFEVAQDTEFTGDSISLSDLANKFTVLRQPYTNYKNLISSSNFVNADVSVFVAPTIYPVSATLGLNLGTFGIPNKPATDFSGVTTTGYFTVQ